jgi:phosphomannomutase
MASSDVMFGVSGFRARVGESFEPTTVTRLAKAFATLIRDAGGKRVVVGRDTRASGTMAFHAVASGLLGSGVDVWDVGVAPTPTILHATSTYDADGSVTITASHNPVEWNGLEFSLRRGRFLTASEHATLKERFNSAASFNAAWDAQGGLVSRDDAIPLHLDRVLALPDVDSDAVRRRRFKVVLDAGNGAGSVISPTLLERLGCEVVRLHCEPDGRFPRAPEPSVESLGDLCHAVLQHRADIGFAHDSDADRLVLVTESGEVVPEEYTFALVADVLLSRAKRPVVTTVVTGGLLDEIARARGVPVIRTPVGVGHVVATMREVDAAVGGESTGGVIVPGTHLTTDGIAAIVVILSGMATLSVTLTEWRNRYRRYHLVKTKIPLTGDADVVSVLDAMLSVYPGATIERIDGVRFLWEDAWVSVRPSGTEPILRVFAESPDADIAARLATEAVERARNLLAETGKKGVSR